MVMSKIVEREFEIDSFVDDLVWIELLEGRKQGFQFAVPVSHEAYSEDLVDTISDLNRGDRISARLRSENDRNTAWRFVDISQPDDVKEPATAPADD
jgi:hypothetical protein